MRSCQSLVAAPAAQLQAHQRVGSTNVTGPSRMRWIGSNWRRDRDAERRHAVVSRVAARFFGRTGSPPEGGKFQHPDRENGSSAIDRRKPLRGVERWAASRRRVAVPDCRVRSYGLLSASALAIQARAAGAMAAIFTTTGTHASGSRAAAAVFGFTPSEARRPRYARRESVEEAAAHMRSAEHGDHVRISREEGHKRQGDSSELSP